MKLLHGPIAALVSGGILMPHSGRADLPSEKPWSCTESVVTEMRTYFKDDPSSGFYAVFRSKLGVEKFPDQFASVVLRNPDPVMAKQKVGDKVQVCLTNFPDPGASCNPSKDSRGRFYRVYNYRLKEAYSGPNANHLCGGA